MADMRIYIPVPSAYHKFISRYNIKFFMAISYVFYS
jgi:hypothetical protein